MNSILTGLFLLLIVIITIAFAYYITLIIGKKTKKFMNGRYTQILERTVIGLNTNITIIKINKNIYIIAMQGKTIEVLDKIDESDWNVLANENQDYYNFKNEISDIFKKRLSKK